MFQSHLGIIFKLKKSFDFKTLFLFTIVLQNLPPAAANVSVHLAAINTGFRSDIGLAVIILPPMACNAKGMG